MNDIESFDPALFGLWPKAPAYDGRADGGPGWSEAESRRQAAAFFLETKSGEAPQDDLRLLLNDMTREMRDQFDYFRKLRGAAGMLAEDADESSAKLARADAKAATDAMSLIVRTLEKVDALQRQLARDRELEAERNADTDGYETARAEFLKLIEERVLEGAHVLYEQWKHDGGPPDDVGGRPVAAAPPADEPGGAAGGKGKEPPRRGAGGADRGEPLPSDAGDQPAT